MTRKSERRTLCVGMFCAAIAIALAIPLDAKAADISVRGRGFFRAPRVNINLGNGGSVGQLNAGCNNSQQLRGGGNRQTLILSDGTIVHVK